MNFNANWGLTILNTALHKVEHVYPSDGFGALAVTVNFSAHCKVKNHFLEFYQAQ